MKTNFIQHIIESSNTDIITRFPPEPNGYLHIGHAKAICLNFGLAQKFKGKCYLRFDDTNPEKESVEYINAIQKDIKWLGFKWNGEVKHASDYFETLFELAVELIKKNLAFVDDGSVEQIRTMRGSLTRPGKVSPFRNRSVKENLGLFYQMRQGDFNDGEKVLRAKIDMASGNMNLRDPIIYRIKKMDHPRTKDWVIYPTYDFAHGQSDAIEHITHSICTLEFEDHKPLYDWFIENLTLPSRPRQYEFSRLNLDYTVMSKRALLHLVENNIVTGWDDPRMPTISGMRRRGYPANAIKQMCELVGVTKKNTITKLSFLEECVRKHLEDSPRVMAVLKPIKVTITNYEDTHETLTPQVHPQKPELGRREISFAKEIFIEQSDFMLTPLKGFRRLIPGGLVRLRYAYVIRCDEVIQDSQNNIVELKCTYFPETKGGKSKACGTKVKGIIHWVSCKENKKIEARLYDRLFLTETPGKDFIQHLNSKSLKVIKDAIMENTDVVNTCQFERIGFFCKDPDSNKKTLVMNKIIPLRDTYNLSK